MKVLSSPRFGASHLVLKRFYLAYICFKIAYCSSFFSTAAKSHTRKLLPIQYLTLCLILGARKTTPILSLEAETNIPPLDLYLDSLDAKLYCKLHFCETSNLLARDVLQNHVHPFSHTSQEALNNYGVHNIPLVPNTVLSKTPPWISLRHLIVMNLPDDYHSNSAFSHYVHMHYPDHISIYTDGSKINTALPSVASGLYIPSLNKATSWRLHPDHTVWLDQSFLLFTKPY